MLRSRANIFKLVALALAVVIVMSGIGVAVLLVISYKIVQVAGAGMEPTLQPGSRIVVTQKAKSIKRNDIVVFNDLVTGKVGLLRVVALPGEKVAIASGGVTVYNQTHPNGFNPDLTDGLSTTQTIGDMTTTVPQDSYFLLGDNRAASGPDSRNIGPVSATDITNIEVRKL